jgi:hypothetical protein
MKHLTIASVLLLASLVAGCGPRHSSEFNTMALKPEMEVTCHQPGQVTVTVEIRQGDFLLYPVRLDSGDVLSATACDGTQQGLSVGGTSGNPIYETFFSLTSECTGPFIVAFSRANDVSAPDSRVSLPVSFKITSPQTGAQVPSGGSLHVAWDPALAGSLGVTGSCPGQNGTPVGIGYSTRLDVGSTALDIPVSDLIGGASLDTTQPCTILVSVEQVNNGQVDPAFGSGSITARQARLVEVSISP